MKEMLFCSDDESWFHHFDPETKRQSMEWHHLDSPTKKKPKAMPSAKKIMGTVFWNAEGCILVEFLEPGKTTNAACYVHTLLKLRCALCDKRPGRRIMLQHDNAQSHTARLTLEKIENMGWEVLPRPPYSPNLAPSDYQSLCFCEESDARPTLRDEQGTPHSCASMSLGSRNGVLPQGIIQTSRTVGKMCAEKRGLRRKINKCLWIQMMYLVFT